MSRDVQTMYRVQKVDFRAYHESESPEAVTKRLHIAPSKQQRAGEPSSLEGLARNVNGWFLSASPPVGVIDLSGHLRNLLSHLLPRATAIRALKDAGWQMDVTAAVRAEGFGGPSIAGDVSRGLGELDLNLWIIMAPESASDGEDEQ